VTQDSRACTVSGPATTLNDRPKSASLEVFRVDRHRRKMTSAQLAAQSASRNFCGETENGINRVVLRWSSAPALTSQDLSRERSSFLLKKNPTGREYSFLYAFLGM